MTETIRTQTARLLGEHQRIVTKSGGPCWCGTWPQPDDEVTYQDHLADLLDGAGLLEGDPGPGPCDAEIHSWERYRPEQIDSYWIRCSLRADHGGKHEDSGNTGLSWEGQ